MPAYSQDFRDIVINKYKEGFTLKELRDFFCIDIRTVRCWVESYKTTGNYSSKLGFNNGRQASFTDKQAIEEYLQTNPDANALEIREYLAPDLARSTFYDCLNRLGFSFKKKTPKYKQRKEQDRQGYLNILKSIDPKLLVYLDEMGVDNKLSVLRGWSLVGEPSYGEVIAYKTQRKSIIAGYNYFDKNIIAPLVYSGYTDTQIFNRPLA